MITPEYLEELSKLKAAVDGHLPKIAKKSKKAMSTVSRVLNGEWINEDVLVAARKVRAELEREGKRLTKLIS